MNIGFRYFIVQGDAITHIAQKRFNEFVHRDVPAFPEYAGKSIHIASVVYELENRIPSRILKVEYGAYKVTAQGTLDENHFREYERFRAHAWSILYAAEPDETETPGSTSVVSADMRFDERRFKEKFRPALPKGAEKAILNHIFEARGKHKAAAKRSLRLVKSRKSVKGKARAPEPQ